MLTQEEDCPVPEHLLGQLYRAEAHGLDELGGDRSRQDSSDARVLLLSPCAFAVDRTWLWQPVVRNTTLKNVAVTRVGFCSRKRVRHPKWRGTLITLSVGM